MAKKNLAVSVFQVILAVLMVVCVSSCSDENGYIETKSTPTGASGTPVVTYECNNIKCEPVDTGFTHLIESKVYVSFKGKIDKFESSNVSTCSAVCSPDTVDIFEGIQVKETGNSRTNSYKNRVEQDDWNFFFNDSREVRFSFRSNHSESQKYEWTDDFGTIHVEMYEHGNDSLISIKFLDATPSSLTKGTTSSTYVKEILLYTYRFEVITATIKGNGEIGGLHSDVVRVKGLSKVWDTNEATPSLKRKGSKPISDKEERDSVEVTLTWKNGHKEDLIFKSTRDRELKALDRRQEILSALDNETADLIFVHNLGEEEKVRDDENWTVFGRTDHFVKNCSVHGTIKEVIYNGKRQRSVFKFMGLEIPFDYNDWGFSNVSDEFILASVSDMPGYDEEDYINRVGANYNGWKHNLSEVISWYTRTQEVKLDSCRIINKRTTVDNSKITFSGEKLMYFSDGSTRSEGKISFEHPWPVVAESAWTINTDHIGSYIASNEYEKSQVSYQSDLKSGSFTYDETVYRFLNHVSGKDNYGKAAIVTRCGYNDGKYSCEFDIPSYRVEKGAESTTKTGSEAGVDIYTYGCEAIVRYGEGVKRVTLPGTIRVDARSHEHGKVREVYFTTVVNENRSYYKSCCVIVFEDSFRKIGLCENAENNFTFTMSSVKDGINSAVYADGRWMPASVVDDTNCMRWRDENNVKRDVVDYLSSTADPWNNGHNTSVDVRREYRISADGYSVTFYLNGQVGQTLNF